VRAAHLNAGRGEVVDLAARRVSSSAPLTADEVAETATAPPPGTSCSGIDTCSFAFRPNDMKAVDRLWERPSRSGPLGSRILDSRLPGDARVLLFPGALVAVEGRLQAIHAANERDHRLAPVSLLPAVAANVRDQLDLQGSPTEMRRVDLAADQLFTHGSDGVALLRSLATFHAARRKSVRWLAEDGQSVETVYWVTPKGLVQLRAYDAGVKHESHRRGERIRVERQWKPPKTRRMTPELVASTDLRALYADALNGWTVARNAAVVSTDQIAGVLLERVDDGQLTLRKAERIAGTLALLRAGHDDRFSRDQRYRRLRELRQLGLAVEDEPPTTEIDVLGVVRGLRDRFAA
jgi:hypothetical protein